MSAITLSRLGALLLSGRIDQLTRCFLRLHLLQAKATRDLRTADSLPELASREEASGSVPEGSADRAAGTFPS